VAISNRRLLALDERGVTFRWKDYRSTGKTRYKAMTLGADEFMRRFLLHVLPSGFHRIRHYGLLANAARSSPKHASYCASFPSRSTRRRQPQRRSPASHLPSCSPHCGAVMSIVETFARGQPIRAPPTLQVAA